MAAVLIASLPLLVQPRFFYTDDYQFYFMPVFREVGRLLRAGELPIVTDRLWVGGALLPEYQFALFNPVSLLLYVLISRMESAPAAAALYSLVHIALFAGGTYFLARTLQCVPRFAALAAITAPTSQWIFYWGAIDWIPALVSIAWMTWAIGALTRLHHDRRWFVPATLGVAMVLVSGWPFALLAMLILVVSVVLTAIVLGVLKPLSAGLPVLAALFTAGLLAAPAILPMFPYLAFTERPLDPSKWQASLAALTAVGMPLHHTVWNAFVGPEVIPLPMTYVAWFIPPVLANAGWRRMLRTPAEAAILILALCYACASQLPVLGQFRWMFRLMPYYHLALVLLVAVVLSRPDSEGMRWRMGPTALSLLVPLALSVGAVPALAGSYLSSTLIVLALVWASVVLRGTAPSRWPAFALASNVLIVCATGLGFAGGDFPAYPNRYVSPFGLSEARPSGLPVRSLGLFPPTTRRDPGEAFWRDFAPGNTGLLTDTISVNGYSPFSPRSYRDHFCFVYLSATTCRDVVARVTAPVPPTGRNLLDLMRIGEVKIHSPAMAGEFREATAGGGWTAALAPSGTTVFSRGPGGALPPDPVSWMSEGMTADLIAQSPRRIILRVHNAAAGEGSIVLARAWYPGWHAALDGTPLRASGLEDLLVQASVPAGAQGQLVIEYWPQGLAPGLWLAACGMVMLAGFGAWAWGRRP